MIRCCSQAQQKVTLSSLLLLEIMERRATRTTSGRYMPTTTPASSSPSPHHQLPRSNQQQPQHNHHRPHLHHHSQSHEVVREAHREAQIDEEEDHAEQVQVNTKALLHDKLQTLRTTMVPMIEADNWKYDGGRNDEFHNPHISRQF